MSTKCAWGHTLPYMSLAICTAMAAHLTPAASNNSEGDSTSMPDGNAFRAELGNGTGAGIVKPKECLASTSIELSQA